MEHLLINYGLPFSMLVGVSIFSYLALNATEVQLSKLNGTKFLKVGKKKSVAFSPQYFDKFCNRNEFLKSLIVYNLLHYIFKIVFLFSALVIIFLGVSEMVSDGLDQENKQLNQVVFLVCWFLMLSMGFILRGHEKNMIIFYNFVTKPDGN